MYDVHVQFYYDMATWKADVFVDSQVGRITTVVEASSYEGARQQIRAKHGNVQQINNLRQVSRGSVSTTNNGDLSGTMGLVSLGLLVWFFISFTPWILMVLGGCLGGWVGTKITGQTPEEYSERTDDKGHGKAAITLALALIIGGVGFVQGHEIQKNFQDTTTHSQSS